ncbi:MAG TPA: SRPBCC family protein [Acidimicrobiia bacterium]|nr:SRPBCC family protein [Acidimicrobiia bacterium]
MADDPTRPVLAGLVDRLLVHVRAGTTELAAAEYEEPVEAYCDPERFALERERLFGGDVPLCVGLSGQLPGPHAVLPFDDYGVPLLLRRDTSGRFRAFLNVCRHRGARVVDGAGTERRMTCGYHGWTYDDGGRLVGVPGAAGFTGVDRDCRGLVEVPAGEAGGLLFVKPRAGALPFDAGGWLGGLAEFFDGLGVASRVYLTEYTLDRPTNWKAAMDTFGEMYHFAFAHRDTLAQRSIPDTMVTDTFGPHQRFAAPTRTIADYGRDPDEPPLGVLSLVNLIYPNAVVMVSTKSVQLYTVVPGAEPGRSLMRQRFFAPAEPESAEQRAALLETCAFYFQVVRDEDWSKAEAIEAGLRSGANTTLVFGRNELCLHRLHDAWRAGLGLPALSRSLVDA